MININNVSNEYYHVDNWQGDCRLMLFSNLLEKFNYKDISPLELIGFGYGLNFNIKKVVLKKIEFFAVEGRDINCEVNFFSTIPGIMKEYKFNNSLSSKEQYLNQMIEHVVDNETPVISLVDRYYLDYLPIKKAHYGYHAIMIHDYDRNNMKFTIEDPLVATKKELSYEQLLIAMFSDIPYSKPEGIYYLIDKNNVNKYEIDYSISNIKNVVRKQCNIVLEEEGVITKIKMLVDFLREIINRIKGKDDYYDRYLIFQGNFLLSTFRELDGSHSFYRELYFEFIEKYLFPLLVDYQRTKLLEMMTNDVVLWKSITDELKITDDNKKETMQKLCVKLTEISNLEKNIFESIYDLVININ